MKTYSELLKDPRWQKVRLMKLEASGWHCEKCYDTETMLSVHHNRYIKGRKPWEYDERELTVLCQPCHEAEHELKSVRECLLSRLDPDGPRSAGEFFAIASGCVFGGWDDKDEQRNAAVRQIRDDNPYSFASGEFLSAFVEATIPRADDLCRLVDALNGVGENDLREDLLAVLGKHQIGVKFNKAQTANA